MSNVDIFIAIALLLAAILGYKLGIVRMVMGLVGLLSGLILISKYRYTSFININHSVDQYPYLFLFLLTLFLILLSILFIYVAILIEKSLKLVMLHWINSLIGTVVSIISATILAAVIVLFTVHYPQSKPLIQRDRYKESVFAQIVFFTESQYLRYYSIR